MRMMVLGMSLIACVGCHKSADAVATEQVKSPATAAPPAAPPAVNTTAHADQALLEPAKAKAFVAYQEKLIPIFHSLATLNKQEDQERAAAKSDGDQGVLRWIAAERKGEHQIAEPLEAARKQAGLSEREVAVLGEIAERMYMRHGKSGEQLNNKVADMEKAVARMPENVRAQMQDSMQQLKNMQANTMQLKDLRAKYGDPIVDAMLAEEPELLRQAKQLSEAAQGKQL